MQLHRMVHMQRGSVTIGSPSLTFTLPPSTVCSSPQIPQSVPQSHSLRRSAAFADLQSCSVDAITQAYASDNVVALIVLLPPTPIMSHQHAPLAQLEDYLLKHATAEKPVFFMSRDDAPSMAELPKLAGQHIVLDVSAGSAAVVNTEASALEATLRTTAGEPVVLIGASMDTLSIAPSLATALDSDAGQSGAVACMELYKLLGALQAHRKSRLPFRFVLLLDGASRLNHYGVQTWLAQQSAADLDNIVLAVHIDTLLAGSAWSVHAAHEFKEPQSAQVLERLLMALDGASTRVNVKKVDVRRDFVWGHEPLAMKQVPAITLSTRSVASTALVAGKSRLLASTTAVADPLEMHVRALVGQLGRALVYALSASKTDVDLASFPPVSEFWGNVDRIRDELALMHSHPVYPGCPSGHINAIQKAFQQLSTGAGSGVREIKLPHRESLMFYDKPVVTAAVHETKPLSFELTLLGGVLAYLWLFSEAIKRFHL
jgi:hypothetical protein